MQTKSHQDIHTTESCYAQKNDPLQGEAQLIIQILVTNVKEPKSEFIPSRSQPTTTYHIEKVAQATALNPILVNMQHVHQGV